MSIAGPLSHIDLSVSEPDEAIPFYGAFFEALGYARFESDLPGFGGDRPSRAAWFIEYPGGGFFGVEVRPAEGPNRARPHDRYAPGLHHMAFHVESRDAVDRVHAALRAAGIAALDAPADYPYSKGYYAAFYADPDGVKLEVVYEPANNPLGP